MTRFHLTTFGCQSNVLDSEVVRGLLKKDGLVMVSEPADADVVLLNGCTIRDTADQKVYNRLRDLAREKKYRPSLTVGVLGCLAQAEGERIREKFPVVDLVMGPDSYSALPEAIRKARDLDEGGTYTRRLDEFLPYADADRSDPVRAFVEVIRGCSKFCTFCVVPYTRGLERSRPMEDLLQEVRTIAELGTRDITLLGQNVDSYLDPGQGRDLADLLRALDRERAAPWLRFITSHPRHFSDRLIEAVGTLDSVCEFIHLPVQSGSDSVLERMNRHTTHKGYLDLARRIRTIPGVALSTDLIVGFPGETEEDFQRTLDIVEEADFDMGFSFKYAPRRETPAASYPDQVPPEIKAERLSRLNVLLNRQGAEHARRKIGSVQEALIEAYLPGEGLRARLRSNQPVFLGEAQAELGSFRKVRITGAKKWSLLGELAGENASPAPAGKTA